MLDENAVPLLLLSMYSLRLIQEVKSLDLVRGSGQEKSACQTSGSMIGWSGWECFPGLDQTLHDRTVLVLATTKGTLNSKQRQSTTPTLPVCEATFHLRALLHTRYGLECSGSQQILGSATAKKPQ